MNKITLYHFTCLYHLPSILRTESLHTTDANLRVNPWVFDPDVLWLTKNPNAAPDVLAWAKNEPVYARIDKADESKGYLDLADKTLIRFVLSLDEGEPDDLSRPRAEPGTKAYKWQRWAVVRNRDKRWTQTIISVGGGDHANWYVTEREIPLSRCERIETRTGGLLWEKGEPLAHLQPLLNLIHEATEGVVFRKMDARRGRIIMARG